MTIRDEVLLAAPWSIPVPVQAGQFAAQYPHLEQFNITTHMAALGPFGANRSPIPSSELLYADLQTTPDYHLPGRLGSGRAGHYRGRYLKGVGRTPLAANWNIASDRNHATGHLATSCALGELIVSWYLEAKGLGDRINGCEGVLLGPLAPELRDHRNHLMMPTSMALPCDQEMQAITVKRSGFARFSNFMWLMNNMDLFSSHEGLVHFFLLFVHYLDPKTTVAPDQVTPTQIARAFTAAVERTVGHFRDFWRAGVVWYFPQNNFTMDGRFQDLDLPLFLGGPFLGVLNDGTERTLSVPVIDPMRIFGLSVLAYLHHVRTFYKRMLAQITMIGGLDFSYSATERAFLQQIVEAFREEVDADHLLLSVPRATAMLRTWVREDCAGATSDEAKIDEMLALASQRRMTMEPVRKTIDFSLREVDIHPRFTQRGDIFFKIQALDDCGVSEAYIAEARFVNDLLRELDAIADRDNLFAALEVARKRIGQRVQPLPDRRSRGSERV